MRGICTVFNFVLRCKDENNFPLFPNLAADFFIISLPGYCGAFLKGPSVGRFKPLRVDLNEAKLIYGQMP